VVAGENMRLTERTGCISGRPKKKRGVLDFTPQRTANVEKGQENESEGSVTRKVESVVRGQGG